MGHSRSLEMAAFKILGTLFCSHFVASMAVSLAICDIFYMKEWHDLENWVRGCSRSLKMVPFDKPHMTFCWSAIVSIVVSCIIFKLFGIE